MSYATAYQRWAGVGPYYAMFPTNFADQVVQQYTGPGQRILDPFAGRASSVFAGAARGRPSIGIEISPVGWIYGQTKLQPATADQVKARVREIAEIAKASTAEVEGDLASFFRLCFCKKALQFLQTCRSELDWRKNIVDRTLMALILVDLHGRRDKSFSNQMSQSKAMHPDYSITWWGKKKLLPPEIDPQAFLYKKISWRYAKGIPETSGSTILLGDSCDLIESIQEHIVAQERKSVSLLFTSPPYIGITDYHRDQWLRLWMLGNTASVSRSKEKHKSAFQSHSAYKQLLLNVFEPAAELMSNRGYVYIRTDARKTTFDITQEVLRMVFPKWREQIVDQPAPVRSQTKLFGDISEKPGERDIILTGPCV